MRTIVQKNRSVQAVPFFPLLSWLKAPLLTAISASPDCIKVPKAAADVLTGSSIDFRSVRDTLRITHPIVILGEDGRTSCSSRFFEN
jgi:hypothetical protein